MHKILSLRIPILFFLAFLSHPLMAYVGPGAGISAIGSFIALIVAVLVAILGFIWYPLKRLLKKNGSETDELGSEAMEKTDAEKKDADENGAT